MGRARTRGWAGAALKRAGERVGVEIRRHRSFGSRRATMLADHDIELVIDVGAHCGEYGKDLRDHGYGGRIVSFEPSPAAYTELEKRAAGDQLWQSRRLALSDADKSLELWVADNFSSALAVGSQLAELFPEAVPKARERVAAARLDEVELDPPPGRRTLLKLDVQGHELRVLAGADGTLGAVAVVEAELSVVPLYEGQPVLIDTLRALENSGFALVSLEPILRDWRTGQHLQFDGFFARRGPSAKAH